MGVRARAGGACGARPVPRLAALGGLVAAGVLLVGVEAAAGGADLGASTIPIPAPPPPSARAAVRRTLQGVVLDGLAGAACDLHVTREDLVLSFGGGSSAVVDWNSPTVEKAVRAGLVRSINESEDRGTLNGVVAGLFRAVAERAPIQEIIRGAGGVQDLGNIDLGDIDLGDLLDRIPRP